MIATQVASKAARDALFLTHFPVSALPLVLIAAAALSIVAALVTTRAMATVGPGRVVPPLFIASALLLLVAWWTAVNYPRPGAIMVYLHVAVLGSILISGFWSIIDEAFDPRTAKRGIGRIIGGATLGGLFGGLIAERVGAKAGVLWVLPILAALQIACAVLLPRFAHDDPASRAPLRSFFTPRRSKEPGESAFHVLRRVGYLRSLALIVLLGNVAATLVDYVFKARAAASFPESADLVRFFALFYTAVSMLTLAIQTGMTRRLLEGIGIANTVAVRPALIAAGGIATLPAMGLLGVGVLRAIEMVVQSSLFRSGYELLFTAVVPDQKRRTKTIVDVGADRMGDIIGGALIRGVILLPFAATDHLLVGIAVLVSLTSIGIARALHRGYVRALEASLLHRANALEIGTSEMRMRTSTLDSFTGIDFSMTGAGIRIDELRDLIGARPPEPARAGAEPGETPTAPLAPVHDPEVAALAELRSGNPKRVHAELNRERTLSPTLAGQAITLLAWDEVSGWASRGTGESRAGNYRPAHRPAARSARRLCRPATHSAHPFHRRHAAFGGWTDGRALG